MNSNLRFKKKLVSFISALCCLGTSQGMSFAMNPPVVAGTKVDLKDVIDELNVDFIGDYVLGSTTRGGYIIKNSGEILKMEGKRIHVDDVESTVEINGKTKKLAFIPTSLPDDILNECQKTKEWLDHQLSVGDSKPLLPYNLNDIKWYNLLWRFAVDRENGIYAVGCARYNVDYAVDKDNYILIKMTEEEINKISVNYEFMMDNYGWNWPAPETIEKLEMKAQVRNCRRQVGDLQKDLKGATSSLDAMKKDYDDLKAKYAALNAEKGKLSANKEEEIKNLKCQLEEKGAQIDKAAEVVKSLQEKLAKWKKWTIVGGVTGGVLTVGGIGTAAWVVTKNRKGGNIGQGKYGQNGTKITATNNTIKITNNQRKIKATSTSMTR